MTRYQILNAPSKWTLSVSFFDKADPAKIGGRRPVTFEIKGSLCPKGARIEVVINQLSWEDGSGESWLFEGYALTGMDGAKMRRQPKVKGWFATTDRKGWIDLDVQPERQPDPHFVALVDEIKRRTPQHTI